MFVWMRVNLIVDCWKRAGAKGKEEFLTMAMEQHIQNGSVRQISNFTEADGIEYKQYMFVYPDGLDSNYIRRIPIAKDMSKSEYESFLYRYETPNGAQMLLEAGQVKELWEKHKKGYNESNQISMAIFDEVKKLNLPKGKYVIVGSGPMVARSIRDFEDIDILVTEDLFEELSKQKQWKEGAGEAYRKILKNGVFEVDRVFWCKDYQPETDYLIRSAQIINGIPCIPLSEVIKFKQALGREKDLKDIELINSYLAGNQGKKTL